MPRPPASAPVPTALLALLPSIVISGQLWLPQVTGGPGGQLEIFDLTTLQQVAAAPGHAAPVTCLLAGPADSNIFFSGSADRCERLLALPPSPLWLRFALSFPSMCCLAAASSGC